MSNWISVEESLPEITQPILMVASGVKAGSVFSYTTDMYAGWMYVTGEFARWPHPFKPTLATTPGATRYTCQNSCLTHEHGPRTHDLCLPATRVALQG
jgi:hypothetical protein